MKRKIILPLLAILLTFTASAQIYVNEGMIEYEVRTNTHKIFGDGMWAEMVKERYPQFATSYYQLLFKDNQSVYQFDRTDAKMKMPFLRGSDEDNIWYADYNKGMYTHQKFVFDDIYLLTDSLKKIEWKLFPNETREIAGFNCRKAQAILFDSVYVFAFYTDEIILSGGPMSLGGLPGMIMGVTIPRMHTSWIATKLQVNSINTAKITPPKKGKQRPAGELAETVKKATKDWGSWGQQSVWNVFL